MEEKAGFISPPLFFKITTTSKYGILLMTSVIEFYVISEPDAGEILVDFMEADGFWDGDNILVGEGISAIQPSARFSTIEEAKRAKNKMEATPDFKGISLRILHVVSETKMVPRVLNRFRTV